MGLENITYKCGCTERKQLCDRTKARKIAFYATIDCPACQAKAAKERVNKTAEKYGLVALVGTEKQIDWAATLRNTFVGAWNDSDKSADKVALARRLIEENCSKNMTPEKFKALCAYCFEQIVKNNTAKFWIDNRFDYIPTLYCFALEYLAQESAPKEEEAAPEEVEKEAQATQEPEAVEIADARTFPLLAACGQEQPAFVGLPLFAACGL